MQGGDSPFLQLHVSINAGIPDRKVAMTSAGSTSGSHGPMQCSSSKVPTNLLAFVASSAWSQLDDSCCVTQSPRWPAVFVVALNLLVLPPRLSPRLSLMCFAGTLHLRSWVLTLQSGWCGFRGLVTSPPTTESSAW